MENDRGFTLVELAVVTMVLGVLLAIVLPSVVGFQNTAHELRIRAALTNGAKAEAALGEAEGAFTEDVAKLEYMVPGIPFGDATDSSIRVVVGDIDAGDSQQVILYARAVTGVWFGLRLVGFGDDAGRHTCRSVDEADMTFAFCTGIDW